MKARPTRAFLPTLLPVSSWVTMEGNELASAKGRVVCFWAEGECFRLVLVQTQKLAPPSLRAVGLGETPVLIFSSFISLSSPGWP